MLWEFSGNVSQMGFCHGVAHEVVQLGGGCFEIGLKSGGCFP